MKLDDHYKVQYAFARSFTWASRSFFAPKKIVRKLYKLMEDDLSDEELGNKIWSIFYEAWGRKFYASEKWIKETLGKEFRQNYNDYESRP